jgi:hypothetical protein
MGTLAMRHFDLLDFVNKSTELGMPKPLAEYQGRRIEEAIEIAIASNQESLESKNLTLKKEIKDLEYAFQNDFKELDLKILAIQKDIKEIEKEIKALDVKIQTVDSSLKVKIEQSKNQIIMWIGALVVASGFLSHFFK